MKYSDFSPLYSSSIGFDRLVNFLQTEQKQENYNYPLYNIELINENKYRIIISVVGFSENDLSVIMRGNSLEIQGKYINDDKKHNYLYKGIVQQSFIRTFQLAEHIQVKSAHLLHGLLLIILERIIPEKFKPKHISIK